MHIPDMYENSVVGTTNTATESYKISVIKTKLLLEQFQLANNNKKKVSKVRNY